MTLHWGIATSESTFIGDTVTLLDTLHWDTLYSLMVDFWDDDLFWGIALSSVMDFDLSWGIVTSDGLYRGIASSFVLIELRDSDSYGLCWDVSIFGVRSGDRLIYWYALCVVIFSSCRLGCIALHWGISIFWREIKLVPYIGASTRWYGSLDYFMLSLLHTGA